MKRKKADSTLPVLPEEKKKKTQKSGNVGRPKCETSRECLNVSKLPAMEIRVLNATRKPSREDEIWARHWRTKGDTMLDRMTDDPYPPHLYYRFGVVTRAAAKRLASCPPTESAEQRGLVGATIRKPKAKNKVRGRDVESSGDGEDESTFRSNSAVREPIEERLEAASQTSPDSGDEPQASLRTTTAKEVRGPDVADGEEDESTLRSESAEPMEEGFEADSHASPETTDQSQMNIIVCSESGKGEASVQTDPVTSEPVECNSVFNEERTLTPTQRLKCLKSTGFKYNNQDPIERESKSINKHYSKCLKSTGFRYNTQDPIERESKSIEQHSKCLKSTGFKLTHQEPMEEGESKHHGIQTVNPVRSRLGDEIVGMNKDGLQFQSRLGDGILGMKNDILQSPEKSYPNGFAAQSLSKEFRSLPQKRSLESSFLNLDLFRGKNSKISPLERSPIQPLGEELWPKAKKFKSLQLTISDRHKTGRFPRSLCSPNGESIRGGHFGMSLLIEEEVKSVTSEALDCRQMSLESEAPPRQAGISPKTPLEAFLEKRHDLKRPRTTDIWEPESMKMATPMEEALDDLQGNKSDVPLAIALHTYRLFKKVMGFCPIEVASSQG